MSAGKVIAASAALYAGASGVLAHQYKKKGVNHPYLRSMSPLAGLTPNDPLYQRRSSHQGVTAK